MWPIVVFVFLIIYIFVRACVSIYLSKILKTILWLNLRPRHGFEQTILYTLIQVAKGSLNLDWLFSSSVKLPSVSHVSPNMSYDVQNNSPIKQKKKFFFPTFSGWSHFSRFKLPKILATSRVVRNGIGNPSSNPKRSCLPFISY